MAIFLCVGWCVLENVFDDDVPLSTSSAAIDAVGRHMQETWGRHFKNFIVDWKNGQCFVLFNQSHNHPGNVPDIISEMLEYITSAAPCSVGMVHMFSTEQPDAFTVLKLLGQEIVREKDSALGKVASS
jgi:hypothetical protein